MLAITESDLSNILGQRLVSDGPAPLPVLLQLSNIAL